MFKVIEGIVKVIKPSGRAVIGIADGKGLFLWLGTDDIKACFPSEPYINWQTTRFLVDSDYQIKWKAERNWEQYKTTYNTSNIIPIPTPMPAEFATEPSLAMAQQPKSQRPLQFVNPPTQVHLTTTPTSIDTIAKELTKIRELLELIVKPTKFKSADEIVVEEISEEQIIEEYGEPPTDTLPEVF